MIISIVLAMTLASTSLAHAEPAPPQEATPCSSIREYITALEYLRASAQFKIPEKNARELALKVSQGSSTSCDGAAKRFIRVSSTLTRAGVLSHDAIQSGLDFSHRSEVETESFLTVFLKSYLQDSLDLTLQDSLRLARSLTLEFHGDVQSVRKDFERIVQFCVGEKDLGLPRPLCASLATRVAKAGENYPGGVAEDFIQMVLFLSSEKGPQITQNDALNLAEKLLPAGKDSSKKLIQAYRYAHAHPGLDLPVREALQFAQEMTLPSKTQR